MDHKITPPGILNPSPDCPAPQILGALLSAPLWLAPLSSAPLELRRCCCEPAAPPLAYSPDRADGGRAASLNCRHGCGYDSTGGKHCGGDRRRLGQIRV